MTIETAIPRNQLYYARSRERGFRHDLRVDQWRKAFAERDYIEGWQEEDLSDHLDLFGSLGEHGHFVEAVTGTAPGWIFYHPRRPKADALGFKCHGISTVAYALLLLHWMAVLPASCLDVIEPLRARLRKRKMLTIEELRVVYAKERFSTHTAFRWPLEQSGTFPDALAVSKPSLGGFVLSFKSGDQRGVEIVSQVGDRVPQSVVNTLFRLAPLNVSAVTARDLKTKVLAAKVSELPKGGSDAA